MADQFRVPVEATRGFPDAQKSVLLHPCVDTSIPVAGSMRAAIQASKMVTATSVLLPMRSGLISPPETSAYIVVLEIPSEVAASSTLRRRRGTGPLDATLPGAVISSYRGARQ